MVATFENTVGILVKAYLDGTLLKGDCQACAVGNLCAAALGLRISIVPKYISSPGLQVRADAQWNEGDMEANWGAFFMTGQDHFQRRNYTLGEVLAADYSEDEMLSGKRQMAATGYTIDQLARIEYAFETADSGYTEEAEFAGLMAVVDVLADIHGVDLVTVEASKLLFVKA